MAELLKLFLPVILPSATVFGLIWIGLAGLRWRMESRISHEIDFRSGDVYEGLSALAAESRWDHVTEWMKVKLPLPDENLRHLLIDTAQKVIAVREVALGPTSIIPEPLREHIRAETDAALDSLWHTCQRLALVKQLRVDARLVESELMRESTNIRRLVTAVQEAQLELAKLSLNSGQTRVHEVAQSFGKIGWATRELRRLDPDTPSGHEPSPTPLSY
jgi:hypothetical protein